jgi:hypothetical protein
MLHWLALFCRDLVMLKVASTIPLYNHDLQAELASLANSLPSAEPFLDLFALLEQLRHCLAMNVNPQLTFEQLVIQLQQLLGTPSIT